MTDNYLLAGRIVEISSVYNYIHHMCKPYLAEETGIVPAFSVQTTQADIDYERNLSLCVKTAEGRPNPRYSDDYLETLAVYRKIAEKMPYYDTFLAHGSAVAVDGVAYLFTAPSGTGKSTHTRLWCKLLGDKAIIVNDDKPLIRVSDHETTVFGTPWGGKHRLSCNMAVPLRAICILERGDENRIERITKSEVLPGLLVTQFYRPADPAALAKTLELIDRMDVAFYRLHCNMDLSAAELSYQTMKDDLTPN